MRRKKEGVYLLGCRLILLTKTKSSFHILFNLTMFFIALANFNRYIYIIINIPQFHRSVCVGQPGRSCVVLSSFQSFGYKGSLLAFASSFNHLKTHCRVRIRATFTTKYSLKAVPAVLKTRMAHSTFYPHGLYSHHKRI